MRQKLIADLKKFKPFNEQEEKDKLHILSLLEKEEDIF